MRKKKNSKMLLLIGGLVFIVILIVILYLYFSKDKYSCIDYETHTYYSFSNEEEMHKVCDQFNGTLEDKKMNSYDIYNDLINANYSDFSFAPYINSDNKLSIIIAITDCDKPNEAKSNAIKWFKNHNYNINDYIIEYEYPCEQ